MICWLHQGQANPRRQAYRNARTLASSNCFVDASNHKASTTFLSLSAPRLLDICCAAGMIYSRWSSVSEMAVMDLIPSSWR
jgi:hypothetical protein